MELSATGSATSSDTSRNVSEPAKTIDYESFLRLLIAQMKNQDPTNPMDSTEYVSQLASFSSVEQQTKTNARLDQLLTTTALTQADGVIGRTITSADGGISGKVAAVMILSGSAVAVLEDGSEVVLEAGIRVS
jgi:flagellar basal-body rod modification protein FlgD